MGSASSPAAELNCKGAFAMGSMWMPCANERALHDALQRAQ
ncbi:MAG: gibberellin regulated-like protein [Vulcanococcus sp.]